MLKDPTEKMKSRRALLVQAGTAAALAGGIRWTEEPVMAQASQPAAAEPFGYCLNTSTISGANLGIVQELEIAATAGYAAIEPWIRELADYQKKGGTLSDLRKRIDDLGLIVADAIGFTEWIVDDDARRAKALEQMKRDMDAVAQIGGRHIAAPPLGAHEHGPVDLANAAERYRAVLQLGEQSGVMPMVELWGASKTLSRLGEVAFVSIEARHRDACMLLDIYHLHRGGSDFASLRQINGAALHVIHVNDYPDHPREQLTDAQRVYPGDGVAPLDTIFRTLRDTGFRGFLSLELFNRDYWKKSPAKVAQTGLEKTRAAVKKSL